mgnify:FL=1
MIEIILILALWMQGGFDSAVIHNHVASLTFEGVWIKRTLALTKNPSQYPLGNQLAIRGANNELWFFYGFDPIKDGPTISMAESTPSGMRTRVTYDPVCFYVTKIELLGPVAVPSPTPTPSPTPVPTPIPSPTPTPLPRENLDMAWPSGEAARSALWRDKVTAEGWTNCVVYNNRIRCWRLRP